MTVSLLIPAYNEAKRLGPFLQSIANFIQRHPSIIDEILVINDGSTDQTAVEAEKYQSSLAMLRVIKHEKNQGKGAAVKTGVMQTKGDLIIFIDADGATPIDELPKMVQALQSSDIAIGNRWMKGSRTQRHSFLRRLSGWVYRQYMRLFGLGKIDTMCGFKGYHRSVAQDLYKDLQEPRWLFDTEITYRALRRGYRITNFPIAWQSKEGSKLSTRTLLMSALQIWPLIRRIHRTEKNKKVRPVNKGAERDTL